METVWRKPLLMLVCKLLIKSVQSFFFAVPQPPTLYLNHPL